jgi:hypothetical protein
LKGEAGQLRAALEEAARRHEDAMAEAEATLRKHREAADFSHAIQARLTSLQSKVSEVSEKEAGAYTRSTFRLNLSALCGIGGACRVRLGAVKGVLGDD